MRETLHYLLMASHLSFQKILMFKIKNTGLTLGQPKVLDYLREHDGAFQKEIAVVCNIEPATLTSVLLGMENKNLITRKMGEGNRRNLYVYLTDKGMMLANRVKSEFDLIEEQALAGFSDCEKEMLNTFLTRINENINNKGMMQNE